MLTMNQSIPAQGENELMRRIRRELYYLGIPGNVFGFEYLALMLKESVLDLQKLKYVTKDLYPSIGRKCGVPARSVERDARTAIKIWWKNGGQAKIEQIAQYPVPTRPSNTRFLAIVSNYIRYSQ